MNRIPLLRQFLPAIDHDKIFCLEASGNNMFPDIKHNDFLICIKTNNLNIGDIAILEKNNKYHCKYYREIKNKVFYEDANKNIFDDSGWKLIGKVSGVFKHLSFN